MANGKPGRAKGKPRKKDNDPMLKIARKRWHVLTVERLAPVLRKYYGNYAAAARVFGVTREAVCMYVKAHSDELLPIVKEAQEIAVDVGVYQLMDSVHDRERWAIEMLLEQQGKARGWGKVMQLGLGGPIQADGTQAPLAVQVYLPDNGRTIGLQPLTVVEGVNDADRTNEGGGGNDATIGGPRPEASTGDGASGTLADNGESDQQTA